MEDVRSNPFSSLICFKSPSIKKESQKTLGENNFNILSKFSTYQIIQENILNYIQTNKTKLCDGLDDDFFEDVFDKSPAILIISKEKDENLKEFALENKVTDENTLEEMFESFIGFALFFINNESLDLELVCSHKKYKGGGEILIRVVEDICNALDIKKIVLHSVDTSVEFYKKYGFQLMDPELKTQKQEGETYEMEKVKMKAGKNKQKLKSYKKKIKRKTKKRKTKKRNA